METIELLLNQHGTLYGMTVTQTHLDGTKERWTVEYCTTMEEAQQKAFDWAIRDGWTPPKWWQFWRWNDTRLPEGFSAPPR